MALTKVTSGAVSGLATSATTDTTDASNITTGTIPTARLDSTLDLSSKTVTLPAASVTAHATNPTKASIEALGIAASSITGALPAISGANLTGLPSDVTVSATVPSSPTQGDLWFNSSASTVSSIPTKTLAVYNNTAWKILQNVAMNATGGTITIASGYRVHAFTSSGTFTPDIDGDVQIIVVGGGASGSIDHGGGGGGGGIAYHSGKAVTANTAYTVTIGAGGAGGYGGHASGSQSGATSRQYPASAGGSNSTFHGLTGYGGGGGSGCCIAQNGASGGSGGGAGPDTGGSGGSATQGAGGTTHYGNAGGGGGSNNSYGGGGGGAGAAGGPQNNAYGGNGARPVTWADGYGTDSSNAAGGGYFGGGGAGAGHSSNPITNNIPQGIGGGGGWRTTLGNYSTSITTGANGMANTGGGGSGIANPVSGSQYVAGNGGTGIVLVAYPA